MSAALGFRAHSGWAAVVVVTGTPAAPVILDRRRLEIADPKLRGSKQPYHAAEGLPFKDAEQIIRRCTASTNALAERAVRGVVDDAQAKGYRVTGCGLLTASGWPLPDLAAILTSHALIHAAEGEMFRETLVRASEKCGLAVTRVRERELLERAAAALRAPADKLLRRLADLGRSLGPPWTQDQKLAALVALLALAAPHKQ
ncbi:MAG: hypothetical protein L0212_08140 [Acidobacteria bacterium]|nr:hypothetical protein [Acidobacteriota bacterium]